MKEVFGRLKRKLYGMRNGLFFSRTVQGSTDRTVRTTDGSELEGRENKLKKGIYSE